MRFARVNGPDGPYFAIEGVDGSWVAMDSIGMAVETTPQLVAAADRIAGIDAGGITGGVMDPDFLAPIVAPGKVLAIALNYLDHIQEQHLTPPENPIVFAKFPNALNGPDGDIVVDPRLTTRADYEAELAVVIGRRTRNVDESIALDQVFGYAVANDVSARDAQRADRQFGRSKSFDTFCPIGPWITSADAVGDPQALRLWARVNGETRQDSSTAEMLFPVAYLIHYLARGMTLEPGDVLLTGTPKGVGTFMDPPQYLQAGDVVECEVEGLGRLRNRVVASR